MLKLILLCAVAFAASNVAASTNTTDVNATNANTTSNPTRLSGCAICLIKEVKCCGKNYACTKNCSGYPCNEDNQCRDDGCCSNGNCTESCSTPTPKPKCADCKLRCCGKDYACAQNCTGYPCDEDSQCGGGCCSNGNCTESCSKPFELTPVQVGLVAGGSALVLSLACTCTCKCVNGRRKGKKQPTNVIVHMHGMPMQENPSNNQPQERPTRAYHGSSPQGNPGVNYGYQTQFGQTGRVNR